MAGGITELAALSQRFIRLKPFVLGMAVYSVILYTIDLFGMTNQLGILSILLGIVSTIITLWISYGIIKGIKDIEAAQGRRLNSQSLMTTWSLMAVFTVISFVFLIFPILALISVVCNAIVSIVFLVAFNAAKNLYYGQSSIPFK